MKFVRLLLIWLGVLIALVTVLVAALFTSPLQTWIAQTLLDRQPGLQSSVGEVSAGFNRVKITDLHLEANGAILTMPSLQASLPVKSAALDHRLMVRSLVAKGWTLDLSNLSRSDDTSSGAAPAPAASDVTKLEAQAGKMAAREVEQVLHGLLGGWKSPCDMALDGVELEGDVIVAVSPDRAPIRVHVVFKGGGMAAGQEGTFAIDALAADPSHGLDSVAAHGRVMMGMSSPRALNRVEIKADLTAQGRWWPEGFAGSVDLAANHRGGESTVAFDLIRDQRHVASVQARTSGTEPGVRGNWTIDARDTDAAPFQLQLRLPPMAVAGSGKFESDLTFSRVHIVGSLHATTNHLEVLTPALESVGSVTIASRFDVLAHGRVLRVVTWETSLAGNHPIAAVRALQAFDFETDTGNVEPANPSADWLEASIQGLPLTWLAGLTGKFSMTGGNATGRFVVRAEKDGFALQPVSPLLAAGVAVTRAGRPLGRGLDLALGGSASSGPGGWQVKAAPFTVSSGGRQLATLTATAARAGGADKPVIVSGTWTADLDAMAVQPVLADFAGKTARSASGEFTVTMDDGLDATGKFTVTGHDPTHSLTANVRANSAAAGVIAFQIPVTFAVGKNVSAFSAEGSWSETGTGVRINGRLAGEDVDLEHLRLLSAPLAAAQIRGAEKPAAGADRQPFWTGWSGEVTLAFERLRSAGKVYRNVGATVDLDAASISLRRAWFGLPAAAPEQVEGALSFDGTAEFPYSLKATATVDDIDVAPLLGTLPKGEDPVLEGHFSLAATVTGKGRNLEDVIRRAQQEYHVTGKNGIIRLLKTSVADALPGEPPTPVADAVGTVGSWVGWLAGVKKDSIGADEKKVSRNTEVVLNLTSQIAEIGYDQISVTATQGHDQTIHLLAIEMTARDERLTGSGQITGGAGLPLGARPLTMELKLGVRGNVAGLLSQAGLLTTRNDELGYLQLVRPLHFGGSLQHCDTTDWHDLLAKAAMRPAPAGK